MGPKNLKLTDRQRQILREIDVFVRAHLYGPSVRELADTLNISGVSAVIAHMQTLERKGLLTREIATWRAVRLTDDGLAAIAVKSSTNQEENNDV